MKTLTCHNTIIGENDQSAIALPIVATNLADLKEQLPAIRESQPDLVEWRIDHLDHTPELKDLKDIRAALTVGLGDLPIIATFRTQGEGGAMPLEEADYGDLLANLAQSDFDLIDVEVDHDLNLVEKAIQASHDRNQLVIASYHNFQSTPTTTFLQKQFEKMANLKADMAKIAVMPKTKADVFRLLTVSQTAQESLTIPIVTMAMGDLGKISRIAGQLSGSAITFASLDETAESAPGQLTIAQIRQIFQLL
ncbi:type I 3-dehydroquinate dehydratase [Fructobacillus americanaquae]|uniref:3-dehydroquinate dehydratase n=1 Tax=Fructobacillus americanaquae TaxID=2940302 RepID=A0ABY5C352_9LACO|nr:type I 3-dehydroquinate dehydratase [Fructobacillus americanaquae]USS91750.1 type I 3-dehydroquinate dehydratase [Fructobacillus americanaquae]